MTSNPALLAILFILIVAANRSHASFPGQFRKLALRFSLLEDSPEVAPSPAPGPGPGFKSSYQIGHAPVISPVPSQDDSLTTERCTISATSCHDRLNMSACLQDCGNAPKELFLLIQNDGETYLKVNVRLSPSTFKEIQVPKNRTKKINISDIQGSILIKLDAGNGECIINSGLHISHLFKQFPFTSQEKLFYVTCLFFIMALMIGGAWTCCKLRKRRRLAYEVQYKELEMGEPELDSPPTNNGETADGWDQGWEDDNWDELKPVKSPNTRHVENKLAAGFNSRRLGREQRND